eukprot:jgi/Antlo1/2205/584
MLSFLKTFFLCFQVLSTTLYYDLGKKLPLLHVTPAAFLESVVFYETYSSQDNALRDFAHNLLIFLNPLVGALLISGLVFEIPLPARCCVPSAIVIHLGLASKIPVFELFLISLPVFILSVGVGCFISGRFLPLGLTSVVLFDIFLAFVLATIVHIYTKNVSRQTVTERNTPSLMI